jgi:hypothetical protein
MKFAGIAETSPQLGRMFLWRQEPMHGHKTGMPQLIEGVRTNIIVLDRKSICRLMLRSNQRPRRCPNATRSPSQLPVQKYRSNTAQRTFLNIEHTQNKESEKVGPFSHTGQNTDEKLRSGRLYKPISSLTSQQKTRK